MSKTGISRKEYIGAHTDTVAATVRRLDNINSLVILENAAGKYFVTDMLNGSNNKVGDI